MFIVQPLCCKVCVRIQFENELNVETPSDEQVWLEIKPPGE